MVYFFVKLWSYTAFSDRNFEGIAQIRAIIFHFPHKDHKGRMRRKMHKSVNKYINSINIQQ